MEHWEIIRAVGLMQDYIERHLKEPITMKQLADVAGYSPYHAARMFRRLTEVSPFAYLRARRLTEAAKIISSDNEIRIIDVAFDFVFGTHESFTRAFSRQFGVSPIRYRDRADPHPMFFPESVRRLYFDQQKGECGMKDKKYTTVFVQVVDRPKRKAIIKRAKKADHYFEYVEEVGCDVYDILGEIKDALYEPVGMWLPERFREEGTSEYVQGVEVSDDYSGPVPQGYSVIDLPACKMMVFQGPPFDEKDFEEAITDLWAVMKEYDPSLYGFEWADEEGPRFQLAPFGYRGYIEARAVRAIHS